MELIERYLYAVTKYMPQSQRQDVADELRDTIHDMAASRSKSGKPTDADIKAVLKELGSPETLALKYSTGTNYLIGPKWFAAYRSLLWPLVLLSSSLILIVMAALHIAEGKTVGQIIVGAFGTAASVAIYTAFWVTALFVVIERMGINLDKSMESGEWDPDTLPQLPQKRQISRVDTICSLVLIAVTALVPALLTMVPLGGQNVPILNPDLWQFWLPALLVLLAVNAVVELIKLKIGNWTWALAGANVVLNALAILFILGLAAYPHIFHPEFMQVWQSQSAGNPAEIVAWSVGITTVSVVVACVWSAISSLYYAAKADKA